jgi:hypothetical protein
MSITSLNEDVLLLIIDLIPREFNRSSLQYSCRYIYRCWSIWSLKTQKLLLSEIGVIQDNLPKDAILIRKYIEYRIYQHQCIQFDASLNLKSHTIGDDHRYVEGYRMILKILGQCPKCIQWPRWLEKKEALQLEHQIIRPFHLKRVTYWMCQNCEPNDRHLYQSVINKSI